MATTTLDFRSFTASPRFDRPILLLYGNDDALIEPAMRVVVDHLKRSAGPIEIDTATATEIAAQPARLFDAFSSASLFQTRAALVVSDVTERQAPLLTDFLAGLAPADSAPEQFLLLSSSALKTKSKLIAAFRAHPMAQAVACYETAMDRAALRNALAERGVAACSDDALETLETLSRTLDPMRLGLTLEKLSLLAEAGRPIDKADVLACEEGAGAELESDLAILLLSGDRAALTQLFATRAAQSGETSGFLASLGRALSGLLSAQIAKKSGRGGGRPLFWKVDKALTAAGGRIPDLAQRLERSVLDVYQLERRSRSGAALEAAEIERLLIRLASLYANRRSGAI